RTGDPAASPRRREKVPLDVRLGRARWWEASTAQCASPTIGLADASLARAPHVRAARAPHASRLSERPRSPARPLRCPPCSRGARRLGPVDKLDATAPPLEK